MVPAELVAEICARKGESVSASKDANASIAKQIEESRRTFRDMLNVIWLVTITRHILLYAYPRGERRLQYVHLFAGRSQHCTLALTPQHTPKPTLFKNKINAVFASSSFPHIWRQSNSESSCRRVRSAIRHLIIYMCPGQPRTRRFTFGSSSSIKLNVSGARNIIACTSSKYGIQCARCQNKSKKAHPQTRYQ